MANHGVDQVTDEEVLRHFNSKRQFEDVSRHWEPELRQLFCRLAHAVHNSGLDWYHINMKGAVRFGCKNPGDNTASSVAGYIRVKNDRISVRSNSDWEGSEIKTIPEKEFAVLDAELIQEIENELKDWNGIPDNLRKEQDGLWPDHFQDDASDSGQENEPHPAEVAPPHSLNTILYGPPGTGKTYATFRRCVEICDETAPPDEKAVGDRYRKLVEEGRVEFVTFHQSYGYEEFVEGLRPQTGSTDTDDDNGAGFRLDSEDGVLKRIAERARKVPAPSVTPFVLEHRNVFKMGLGNPIAAEEQGIFEECIENGYALLGWGGNVDWSESTFSQYEKVLKRWKKEESDATGYNSNVKFVHCFRNLLSEGDLIVIPTSQQKFRAVGQVIGPYEFKQRADGIYPHRRNVKWLWVDRAGMAFSELYDYKIIAQTIYQLRPEILRKDRLIRYIGQAEESLDPQPHVLVIDEINRGNISKVFGEAITLVEKDKRSGARNEISVTLPYSSKPFTLPPNLYILGTMNTADRSIALLDTALRRRFDFEELAPNSGKLNVIDGIDLPKVLDAMNKRLEWLLGRDHLIGHAWLMAAEDRKAVDHIMRHKIVPMLAEYFHDDWGKVRAVLGGGVGFVAKTKLDPPPELDNTDTGEDRYSWTIRSEFPKDAYDRLIAGKARQTDARDDGTDDGSD